MRINVYSEELTERVELVTRDVEQSVTAWDDRDDMGNRAGRQEAQTVRFYGVRLFLKSPQSILDHSTPEDNDETAITFWVREAELTILSSALENMHRAARAELEASWDRQGLPSAS